MTATGRQVTQYVPLQLLIYFAISITPSIIFILEKTVVCPVSKEFPQILCKLKALPNDLRRILPYATWILVSPKFLRSILILSFHPYISIHFRFFTYISIPLSDLSNACYIPNLFHSRWQVEHIKSPIIQFHCPLVTSSVIRSNILRVLLRNTLNPCHSLNARENDSH